MWLTKGIHRTHVSDCYQKQHHDDLNLNKTQRTCTEKQHNNKINDKKLCVYNFCVHFSHGVSSFWGALYTKFALIWSKTASTTFFQSYFPREMYLLSPNFFHFWFALRETLILCFPGILSPVVWLLFWYIFSMLSEQNEIKDKIWRWQIIRSCLGACHRVTFIKCTH